MRIVPLRSLSVAVLVAACASDRARPPADGSSPLEIADAGAAGSADGATERGLACGDVDLPGAGVSFIGLRVDEIGSRRAVVRFETSEPTTCEVEWGLAPDALDRAASDPDMDPDNPYAVGHEVPLEDLPPGTTIHFRARATTPGGMTWFSDGCAFPTAPSSPNEPAWVNVAPMGMIAGRSSNFGGAADQETWGAAAAIDGMMATEWSSNGDGDGAWLTVDLGRPYTLVGSGFCSRKMTDGTSIVRSIELTFDGADGRGPYQTPNPDHAYKFGFTRPVVARQVRLDALTTSGGNTGVKELELFVLP
ncbi:MAG: discoidin domain-containing protein [Deltaproteobacteria bacterium]|nr:discoidin domain-containing protein [Deltaproteobacteria bacterium]